MAGDLVLTLPEGPGRARKKVFVDVSICDVHAPAFSVEVRTGSAARQREQHKAAKYRPWLAGQRETPESRNAEFLPVGATSTGQLGPGCLEGGPQGVR